MNLVFFKTSCGPGMKSTTVLDCGEMDDVELSDLAYQLAVETAMSYGDLFTNEERCELEDNDEWDCHCFSEDDLDYSFEPYNPEKHDDQRCGGGSFLDELK